MESLGDRLAPLVSTETLDMDAEVFRGDLIGREAALLGALSQILALTPDHHEQQLRRCLQVGFELRVLL